MKKLIPITFSLFVSFFTIAQDSLNFTKLSTWTSVNASQYNDIWGYTSGGREYAILGSNWGTHFIDVTNPQNPVEINSFIGNNSNVTWRDFKVSGNYAYGVADNFGNSLQIFDLSNLPTSVSKVYDNTILSESSHNIFIENNRVYLPSNRRNGTVYALDILDIANPTNPVLIGTMDNTWFNNCWGCLHDIYVKNDTAFCSAGNEGLFIYDLKNVNSPQLISFIDGYSEEGYNHASWVDEDGTTMVMADETHGSGLKSFDLTDIENPVELDVFKTYPDAIPHNPFIRGTEAYISYYHDGMQVFDISDPTNVTQKAYYDTYPDNASNNHSGYEGNWGVYPFFESRNIIASDISYGLFVLDKINDVYTTDDDFTLCFPDSNISIPYQIKGTFNAGNTFHLELSDSNGTFRNPTTIASINSTTVGTFNTNLPANLAKGNEYKVRVRSTNPAVVEGEYQRIFLAEEISKNIDTTICQNDSIIIGDSIYNNSGIYSGIISGGINCDTTYNLNLQVINTDINITDTICSGNTYSFNGSTFDSTGIYSGTIINLNGCDSNYTIDLFFKEIEIPTITSDGNILSAPSGFTYQWLFNNQIIIGATNQTYSPTTDGTFSIIISDGICEVISEPFEYIFDNLKSNISEAIKIYPNPSKGIINIKNINSIDIKIEIINSLGQKVKSLKTQSNISIELEKGIYTAIISTKDSFYTEKIIIE